MVTLKQQQNVDYFEFKKRFLFEKRFNLTVKPFKEKKNTSKE